MVHWLRRLQECFGNSLRLTRDLRIEGESDVTLTMAENVALSNMQTDAAAFETWALALRVAGAKTVRLSATGAATPRSLHANRLRYRADRFAMVFPWFSFAADEASPLPRRPQDGSNFVLNVPTIERPAGNRPVFSPRASESEIELALTGPLRKRVEEHFELRSLSRQLPVGVFAERKSGETRLFPGTKACIDMWGFSRSGNGVTLFELKNAANTKLGALTEALFYSWLIRDLQQGIVRFHEPPRRRGDQAFRDIAATEHVKTVLLAPRVHPLVASSVIELINKSMVRAKVPIELGVTLFDAEARFMRDC